MNEHTHVVLSKNPPEASFGMPHCRDCRFWDREHAWLAEGSAHGRCARGDGVDGQPSDASSLAFADDRASHQAIMLTAPTFGCVQFQPKDGA